MPQIVKGGETSTRSSRHGGGVEVAADGGERRVIRSRYLAVKNLISDERDDISRVDSDKFNSIIHEVESLHQLVKKPREQVADAEALLDITTTLLSSVKAHCNGGVTPSEFVACLIRDFGERGGESSSSGEHISCVDWKKIGLAVPHDFVRASGCCTMLGPMNVKMKQRAVGTRRRHVKPTSRSRPEELDETSTDEKRETDKNMATVFDIMKKNRRVRLEKLVLNRNSFAETVENIFALSFLVKDGRAEITIDEKGYHLVSPRNAPAANADASCKVPYSHFIFRFDFKDWKFMMESIEAGEELMPNRNPANISSDLGPSSTPEQSRVELSTTPIRKLSRNRGLVFQETVVADSPESDNSAALAADLCKGKRKLRRDW